MVANIGAVANIGMAASIGVAAIGVAIGVITMITLVMSALSAVLVAFRFGATRGAGTTHTRMDITALIPTATTATVTMAAGTTVAPVTATAAAMATGISAPITVIRGITMVTLAMATGLPAPITGIDSLLQCKALLPQKRLVAMAGFRGRIAREKYHCGQRSRNIG
jgi:hypothetical protein